MLPRMPASGSCASLNTGIPEPKNCNNADIVIHSIEYKTHSPPNKFGEFCHAKFLEEFGF